MTRDKRLKHAACVQSEILVRESVYARIAYHAAIRVAFREYGNGDGRDISGVVRDHFPEAVKTELRRMARLPAELVERSLSKWHAAGRHTHTWRRERERWERSMQGEVV